jgi:putative restriction endonuclease
MANRGWTYNELLLAFNLYCRLPFGLYHHRNPEVIALSELIDRTPSAVAMKLTNLASLDPRHQSRGVKGLSNTSRADREAWKEFTGDWEKTVWESEILLAKLKKQALDEQAATLELMEDSDNSETWVGPNIDATQIERVTRVRVGQRFFRCTILASYRSQCCICRIPIPSLLIASHIIPWRDREDLRLNPHNGLCLCALHDKAFDAGLLTVDEQYRVVIARQIKDYLPNEGIETGLIQHHGRGILLPDKFVPEQEFLQYHSTKIFLSH